VSVTVLVPGYGGRVRAVERWRIAVALRTLDAHGGGRLVVSGHRGEAERLAALAPADSCVDVESTARSTLENVQRSIPFLLDAEVLALASDRFHRRRALAYMRTVRPELAERVVEPVYSWRDGWWMDAAGAAYELSLPLRRVVARAAR
jgi:uncharacterized SAM-binding protein YcdF (DUF218 family)